MRKSINRAIRLFLFMAVSCQTKTDNTVSQSMESRKFEGELYFKMISLGSFYGVPDSVTNKFESMIDSLNNLEKVSDQDQQLIDLVKTLKENDLMDKPFFHLKLDSTKVVAVYLDERQYEQIKKFDRQRLINENKKVNISLKGRIIQDELVECYEILSTEKVEGKTYWRK